MSSVDSFGSKSRLQVGDDTYEIFRLDAVPGTEKLPYSLKVLAENLLRTEDGANITADHVRALAAWDPSAEPDTEIQFTPARVIMQDFTGVPCVVDLATMREAMADLGGDPTRINPLAPAELVIDHSVQIDVFGRQDAFQRNVVPRRARIQRERIQPPTRCEQIATDPEHWARGVRGSASQIEPADGAGAGLEQKVTGRDRIVATADRLRHRVVLRRCGSHFELDAPSLGALFFLFEATTAFAGELYGIDAFDQPGVELGKKLATAILGRPGAEAEAEDVRRAEQSRPSRYRV